MVCVPWCVGALFSGGIVGAAYGRHDLSPGGAAAAFILGWLVYVAGGLIWSVVLIAFFFSASALSHWQPAGKQAVMASFAKGGTRDAAQVLANGGVALSAALFAILQRGRPGNTLAWWVFLASLAAATADTWATEIGTLGRERPRLLTNWQPVSAGRSGGVTWLGSWAALAGATFITLIAWGALRLWSASWPLPTAQAALIILAGVVGAFLDSFLGATVQAQYFCPHCEKITETRLHHCGTTTLYRSGWRWLNNDWVNFFGLCGAVVVVLLGSLLF